MTDANYTGFQLILCGTCTHLHSTLVGCPDCGCQQWAETFECATNRLLDEAEELADFGYPPSLSTAFAGTILTAMVNFAVSFTAQFPCRPPDHRETALIVISHVNHQVSPGTHAWAIRFTALDLPAPVRASLHTFEDLLNLMTDLANDDPAQFEALRIASGAYETPVVGWAALSDALVGDGGDLIAMRVLNATDVDGRHYLLGLTADGEVAFLDRMTPRQARERYRAVLDDVGRHEDELPDICAVLANLTAASAQEPATAAGLALLRDALGPVVEDTPAG